ncbi:MAG: 4Fe-4S binding protein [Candidatus Krumholzibacteriales bacterium]
MKREIISINEELCNGCGDCIPSCPEGALQIIDGKARLVSDLFCDGLGACIGNCPQGAITIEERESEPYDEARVMENIIGQGAGTIKAHLEHLRDHGQTEYLREALAILYEKDVPVPDMEMSPCQCGCPGSAPRPVEPAGENSDEDSPSAKIESRLRQWPVQLHLINPSAPYLENADLLISADCVPFAFADFHRRFVEGRIVITLCPKLDSGIESYVEKLSEIFRKKKISSITIARMEVPCCGGIEAIIKKALDRAGVSHLVRMNVISISGEIL